jgi:hypothetical protein
MANSYDPGTDPGKVRLLLNDISSPWVFQDVEIEAFLAMEGNVVKRAAALAIATNATNEVLASKVLRTQDLQTDGAKVADVMLKAAASLRAQAQADADADDEGFFDVVDILGSGCSRPELTQGW